MKKNNLFNNRSFNLASSLLVGLQLVGVTVASAAPTAPTANDVHEKQLLKTLISLDGQNVSNDDYNEIAINAVKEYRAEASPAGRSDRLAQAVVEMQVMTQDQADAMKQSIDTSVTAALAANPSMSDDQRQQVALAVTAASMKNANVGAQFGKCTGAVFGASAILAGAILEDVYASTLTVSTVAVTGQVTTSGSGSGSQGGGSSSSGSTSTTSGSQTTSTSSYTANATEKKMLLATSGIAYGISGAMFIYAIVEGSDDYNNCW